MNSQKYTGWEIEKDGSAYLMTRPDWEAKGTFYAIVVTQDEGGEWSAESLTRQKGSWEASKKSEYGPVPTVVKEIERRAEYWMNKAYNR